MATKNCGCPACQIIFGKKEITVRRSDLSAESIEKLAFKRALDRKFDELLAIQQVMRLRRQRAERLREGKC